MKNPQLESAWNALEREGFEIKSFEYRGDELCLKVKRMNRDDLSDHLQYLARHYGKETLISALEAERK